VKNTNNDTFARCEVCNRYCAGGKYDNNIYYCRLRVLLPKELVEEIGKSYGWLCLRCVRYYCKDTISDYWRGILFDKNGKPTKSY